VSLAPVDQALRETALDVTRSFIVQAPAGSGKTALLVMRFLSLLAQVKKVPEECLAITFTRKAALEMRERVINALEQALKPCPLEDGYEKRLWLLAQAVLDKDQKLAWNLLDNPNRLKIQTFDALCAGLAQRLPLLSGFGAMPKVSEKSAGLYQKAARDLLSQTEAGDPWALALNRILAHLDNRWDLAFALFAEILGSREQWLNHIRLTQRSFNAQSILEAGLKKVAEEALQAVSELAAKLPAVQPWINFAAAELKKTHSDSPIAQCGDLKTSWPSHRLEDLPLWLGVCELLLTKEAEYRVRLTQKQGFPAPSHAVNSEDKAYLKSMKEGIEALLETLAELPEFLEKLSFLTQLPALNYNAAEWELVEALVTVLPILVAHLKLTFQEIGEVDFTEIMLAAHQALGDSEAPSDLALSLDYRIGHILVDEFQDTSVLQLKLLEKLMAGWQRDDGRTIFLVGDPMQSIYRFRQAEVGLFLKTKEQGIANIPLDYLCLTVNFRSEPGLVTFCNEIFSKIFPRVENIARGAITFSPAEVPNNMAHGAASFSPVEVLSGKLNSEAANFHLLYTDTAKTEIDHIMGLLREAQQGSGSIAILVRSRAHLGALIPSLRKAAIAFRGVEIEPLKDRLVIQDLWALTRALLHLADRVAWLAVLRSPAVGLDLASLDLLIGQQPSVIIWLALQAYQTVDIHKQMAERLKRTITVLSEALEQKGRQPLALWVKHTWLALGGPHCLNEASDLDDVEAFFKLLREHTLGSHGIELNEGSFESALSQLYASPAFGDVDKAIQIMTIHKAKGLEFDTVIVPGLSRRFNSDDEKLMLWHEHIAKEGQSHLILAPIKPVGSETLSIYRYLRLEAQCREELECVRLAYVAATRAKKKLHFIASLPLSKQGKGVASGSLLSLLYPALEPFAKVYLSASIHDRSSEEIQPSYILKRLPQEWFLQEQELKPSIHTSHGVKNSAVEYLSLEPENDAKLPSWQSGLIQTIRRLLTQIVRAEISFDRAWLLAQGPRWLAFLQYQGASRKQAENALVWASEYLLRFIDSPRGRWLLAEHQDNLAAYKLSAKIQGTWYQGLIDRAFKDEADQQWLIHYVMDNPSVGLFPSERARELQMAGLEKYATLWQIQYPGSRLQLGLYDAWLDTWHAWDFKNNLEPHLQSAGQSCK